MEISNEELDLVLKNLQFDQKVFDKVWNKINEENSNDSKKYDPFLHLQENKALEEAMNIFRKQYQS